MDPSSLMYVLLALPALVTLNMDRVQRKAQQTEIENMKVTIDNLKATAEARENEIAKLKHEVRMMIITHTTVLIPF